MRELREVALNDLSKRLLGLRSESTIKHALASGDAKDLGEVALQSRLWGAQKAVSSLFRRSVGIDQAVQAG